MKPSEITARAVEAAIDAVIDAVRYQLPEYDIATGRTAGLEAAAKVARDADAATDTISLIIAGSRTLQPTPAQISTAVAGMLGDTDPHAVSRIKEVVSGGARGPDLAGDDWARQLGIPVHREDITEADILEHGKWLGPKMRNRRMANRGDAAIVFWDGTSTGAADMVTRMVVRAKPAIVVPMPAERRGGPRLKR